MRTALIALTGLLLVPSIALAAGPPFPDPVTGQAVYDTARVLEPATIATLEGQIDAIEADIGAEIVVYTQLVEGATGYVETELHARALMDQWGVGRAGVNDGLVILFDLYEDDPCHGQVQLFAGSGFRDAWLSDEDRQRIFENDMLPHLRECDMDGAALVALERISGVRGARQLNAVLGLVVAPLILGLAVAVSLARWWRAGKDPVYLDDPSILMPAPPPGLTPAAGSALREGSVTRRALTAATLDLAARGRVAFQAKEKGGLLGGGSPEIGIYARDSLSQDPVEQARLARVRRRPMDEGTAYMLGRLQSVAGVDGWIDPDDILRLGQYVSTFNANLERHLVGQGWYRERPGETVARWAGRGVIAFVLAIVAVIAGANLPSSGLILIGVALLVSAIWLWIISGVMPARTKAGSVVVAMLEAYRRTLEKTMAQARSMGQVVEESAIPLIEDPDDAVVWGTALGLHEQVEEVLKRTAEDVATGRATHGYMPLWYSGGSGSWGSGGGGGGMAPGLLSSSPIPNFGGMMTALSTIGDSPSSSGSGGGGGGGFSGGSSGGGGGAGGGF